MLGWIRDRSLGLVFVTLFLAAWVAQFIVQYQEYKVTQDELGEPIESILSSNYMAEFWQATLENWQSEFLQLASFVILSAYLVYKGAAESPDGNERIEAMTVAIAAKLGIDPEEVQGTLKEKHRRR
jgi:hypothetical protein